MAKTEKSKGLIGKVTERLEILQTQKNDDYSPVISIEVKQSLEKSLQSYLDASAYLEGSRKEYEVAKGHREVAEGELRNAYKHVKKLMKQQAEANKISKKKRKTKKS